MQKEALIILGMDKMTVEENIDYTYDLSKRVYDFKKIVAGIDKVRELERRVLLEVIDSYWIDHIDAMD